RKDRDPWAILVSEVMGQQTPMARVVPRWREWMSRWPTPAALAAASPAEVLRAWDRLGYPRRALALQRAATTITTIHDGEVPADPESLLALPGVGPYTAAAVRAFAFRQRTAVLDTNVRRVLARLNGLERPATPAPTRAEAQRAEGALPASPEDSATWNEALMELGATVCTPRPDCEACPLAELCGWRAAGYPASESPRPRSQAWAGTDRQARGRIMALLRDLEWATTDQAALAGEVGGAVGQGERALAGLEADGLVSVEDGRVRLGGAAILGR
ncbi:MAG: A/G-specific adenine glycosylase, partial [bacterium]|nr:A/G-specific adenine glycosylase [bacterium]